MIFSDDGTIKLNFFSFLSIMELSEALSISAYAQRMVNARPEYLAAWERAPDAPLDWVTTVEAPIAEAVSSGNADWLNTTLRQTRQKLMLNIMARDLLGIASLDEVCGTMCRFADTVVRAALNFHGANVTETRGTPKNADGEPQSLIVVGMGKLGGGELNVSSDIDLVFLYPEEGETDGERAISNHEYFKRVGQRVIATLDELTADGFVFRVDMRLRPHGDSAPLAVSYDAFEQYLLTQGRMWERYAWLKGRPLTGSDKDHAALTQLITPFVYRKYLDFDAYEGLRDVREQIRREGEKRNYADNIKLGMGGIREIEFIAQAQQIVRGGRNPALRVRGTQDALRVLAAQQMIPADTVAQLLEAYVFLRKLEHRLQYREDQATQTLPQDADIRKTIAFSMGFDSTDAFLECLALHRERVARHFSDLLGTTPVAESAKSHGVSLTDDPHPVDIGQEHFVRAGFDDPEAAAQYVSRYQSGGRFTQLPARSQERALALIKQSVTVAKEEAGLSRHAPDALFFALFSFLETISRRSAYLALLSEHTQVLPMIARLVGASSWAAEYLNRHPILLDELLMPHVLLAEPDWIAWRQELSEKLADCAGDTERQMDELRHFQHAQTFRLLAQDLAGTLTVERLADHLTALADLILETTMNACWAMLSKDDIRPRFAVIGYGKLGSKEMSYGSDLDLVFLYETSDTDDERMEQRYTRLAQRINSWLNSTTAAGNLYATDLRLRPDGGSGMFVTSWEGFIKYQNEKAWTFEHQALTRARFVAGDSELGGRFMRERAAILQRPRKPSTLVEEVVAMRERMYEAHTSRDAENFHLKQDEGGMIDIEFIVQYLILANAHQYPILTRNTGNVALLSSAAALGLIDKKDADAVSNAYRTFRRLTHACQLQGREAKVPQKSVTAEREAVSRLWRRVIGGGAQK
ncbi:MAG: bifunctional [glutamate--ammonia ligase]-adenylyl-L-tyrosine phosphorylase/[glutamate--ammonia-ligase] adenylyltransferase [Burkholderiales bacterium]|nr:bifunctional [glutamate--ammonia ligase]-adenylyl-L-tyrosine phosphorylase/[glutamate--ammonia-ligase] adenylyltransferase [Burkholderiales bacterium]